MVTTFELGVSDKLNLDLLECNAIKCSKFDSTIKDAKINEKLSSRREEKTAQVIFKKRRENYSRYYTNII